jgi:hypothetical protein
MCQYDLIERNFLHLVLFGLVFMVKENFVPVVFMLYTHKTLRAMAHQGIWQPQRNRNFREFLSDWFEHVELNGVEQIEETATQLQRNSRMTEILNSQETEQVSLLTLAFPHGFLISAVTSCFSDSFASLNGTKGRWSCSFRFCAVNWAGARYIWLMQPRLC